MTFEELNMIYIVEFDDPKTCWMITNTIQACVFISKSLQ